jgi:hypothetical protein
MKPDESLVNFRELRLGEVRRRGGEHGGLFARNVSGTK